MARVWYNGQDIIAETEFEDGDTGAAIAGGMTTVTVSASYNGTVITPAPTATLKTGATSTYVATIESQGAGVYRVRFVGTKTSRGDAVDVGTYTLEPTGF